MERVVEKYKQTEVGLIPSDWVVKTLDELGKFSKGSGVRKDEALSGDIPCVRYGELYTRHSDYIKQFYSFISKNISEKAKKLKLGDILFAGSGETKAEIGKSVAFINEFEAYAGGDIVILSPNNVVPLYLGYLLNAPLIQKQKASKGQGDAVVHISSNQLSSVKIPLPPTLNEQTAIATALSDADTLLSSLENLIEKKRNIKQGAMQKLLQPKEGWEVKKLGEFDFDISDGNYSSKYPSASEFKTLGVPFIRANNIKMMTVTDNDMRYISSDLHKELAKGHLKKDDILITTRGEIGQIAIVPDCFIDSNINAQIVRINTCNKINKEYFAYFILKTETQETLLSFQTGSALKQLPVGKLKELQIIYPKSDEQTRIATVLSDMDAEIKALETKLEKYKKVKLGMMQNLLTGKIRLV